MFRPRPKKEILIYLREIIFGLEDSLVSTLGAVTGIAAGAQSTYVVILAGLTLVAVEACSMAAGTYLSSRSAAQAQEAAGRLGIWRRAIFSNRSHPFKAAATMGIFYLAGGLVPLTPYFFLPVQQAYWPSIAITVSVLFSIGIWSADYTKRPRLRSGLEMAGISLGAAALGYAIGALVGYYWSAGLN